MNDVDLTKLVEVGTLTQLLGTDTMFIVQAVLIGMFAVGALMSHQKIVRIMLIVAAVYVVLNMSNML